MRDPSMRLRCPKDTDPTREAFHLAMRATDTIPFALTTPATDFDATAEQMRGDLRTSEWVELPHTTPERWRSPDRRCVLSLASAWERARLDAEGAPAAPRTPPRELTVDRDPALDQRTADNDDCSPPFTEEG